MNETTLEYPIEYLQPNYDHEGGALHELALFAKGSDELC